MALFSNTDLKNLESNPNVKKVTKSNVTYTPKFKILAVKKMLNGFSPREIFMEAGVDLQLFGDTYAKKSLQRWRKIYKDKGENGLKQEHRGSGATGRPAGKKFKSLDDELAYLRAENNFLKKLHALAEKYEKKKNSR